MKKHLQFMLGLKKDRGAVAVLVGILMVVFIGFAGMAIDFGYILLVRNELKNISDAAALAAARQLGDIYEPMSYKEQQNYELSTADLERIRNAAKDVASNNRAGGVNINLNDDDIIIGQWDAETKSLTSTTTQPDTVRVIARREDGTNGPVSTFFARVFGIDTMNVSISATAALTPRTTSGPGELGLPVAISRQWFVNNPEFCDQAIRLYPTGTNEGCVGWHTFTNPRANDREVRKIIKGMIDGTFTSPAAEANITEFVFVRARRRGVLSRRTLARIRDLFNMKKDASGEWETHVVVYDSNSCANPSGSIMIVGFATVIVTNVNVLGKRIDARVVCDNVEPGRGSGVNYGTKGSIPGLVE